jgi:predicted  nucleic acid-binding Zn-ribbon protein
VTNQDILPDEPPTPPTKTSEALRSNLQTVNANLEKMRSQWEDEKQRLLGEKAVLQDVANRMDSQIRTTKREMKRETKSANEKAKSGVQGVHIFFSNLGHD